MSWTWWAYNHSKLLFMRALQVNFTILGICMCSTELLAWKNQKRSTGYSMTLQKRDSIAHFFPGVDLGRGYRGHVPPPPPPPPPPPYLFWNCAEVKHAKTNNINNIYQIELRSKGITCLMIIAETKKTFSAFEFFH